MAPQRPLTPLVGVFLGLGLVSVAFGLLALPAWLHARGQSRRGSNERTVGGVLKALASAEAQFRGLDADGNGIQDYWTGDVAGLYRWGLIDRATAMADLRPIVPLCPRPVPRDGYFFVALELDRSLDPPEAYRQTTDPASGPVHNLRRFGFIAIPAEPGVTGTLVAVINEGNSMRAFRPAAERVGHRHWPDDEEFRREWSTFG